MSNVFLVFPTQLFENLPVEKEDRIVFVEFPTFFKSSEYDVSFHKKKIILLRASMLSYRDRLRSEGRDTEWLNYADMKLDPFGELMRRLKEIAPERISCFEHFDLSFNESLNRAMNKHGVRIHFLESPMFATPREFFDEVFPEKSGFSFLDFYSKQRVRMEYMVLQGKPSGGKWMFDPENRHNIPRSLYIPPPPETRANPHVKDCEKMIGAHFPHSLGDASDFFYPTTHAEAEKWLESFLEFRLHLFAKYFHTQHSNHPFLFHSGISPFLNIGLLTPAKVLEKLLDAAREHAYPQNSAENFFRQVFGWREYTRFLYERMGKELKTSNDWGFQNRLPKGFLHGNTEIIPLNLMVRKLMKTGQAHFSERMFVAGAFMMLCELRPSEVYRWFLSLSIDSYDWCLTPNVYGISQFSMGNAITSTPKICGSAGIRRLSNYPNAHWTRIWDGLFYKFLENHKNRVGRIQAYQSEYQNYEKLDESQKRDFANIARAFIQSEKIGP